MDIIYIEQLKVDAIIGVYDFERLKKQPLIIDLELQYDSNKAAVSDKLEYALDYHQISKDIHAFVSDSSYQLIESLAQAIAENLLKNKLINKVTLSLSKPKALDLANNVGIRINRSND